MLESRLPATQQTEQKWHRELHLTLPPIRRWQNQKNLRLRTQN